jgi:hypothetical protein
MINNTAIIIRSFLIGAFCTTKDVSFYRKKVLDPKLSRVICPNVT